MWSDYDCWNTFYSGFIQNFVPTHISPFFEIMLNFTLLTKESSLLVKKLQKILHRFLVGVTLSKLVFEAQKNEFVKLQPLRLIIRG